MFGNAFPGFGQGIPQSDPVVEARIIKLEKTIAAHRAALLKINDLLKVCIQRIETLETRNAD